VMIGTDSIAQVVVNPTTIRSRPYYITAHTSQWLAKVGGLLLVLRFPPPIKLTATI
jgi:hypothetical protein